MRKHTLLSSFFILSALFCFGQDNYLPTMYYVKDNLLNPGFTGIGGGINIKAAYKLQLLGFTDAPNVKVTGVEVASPGNNIAYGLNIAQDQNGPLKKSMAQGIFAYRINYDTESPRENSTHFLSIGITGGVHQHILEYAEFRPLVEDPLLQALEETSVTFNSDFGLLYVNKGFRVGLAFHDIVSNKINSLSGRRERLIYPSGYLNLGYAFNPSQGNLVITPNVVLGAQLNDFVMADLNLGTSYFLGENKSVGLRAGYRSMRNYNGVQSGALMLQADVAIAPLVIGYQHTLPMAGNQMYSMGEQAFFVGLQFNSNKSTQNPGKDKTMKKPRNWFN